MCVASRKKGVAFLFPFFYCAEWNLVILELVDSSKPQRMVMQQDRNSLDLWTTSWNEAILPALHLNLGCCMRRNKLI